MLILGHDTKVEFHVFYRGPLADYVNVAGGPVYLQDASGKQDRYNILATGEEQQETQRRKVMTYYLNLRQAPLCGKVTLHARLRGGDFWPLDVQAVVRPLRK